jgi:predicted ester cyclase
MSIGRNLRERYAMLYNAGDVNACVDLYAEHAVKTTPYGVFAGRNTIRDRLIWDLEAFPDARYSLVSFVEQGDKLADEFTMVGTHRGPFTLPNGAQIPPTYRRVEIRGMELARVRDGRIVVDNLYYDNMAVLTQLGLVPLDAST